LLLAFPAAALDFNDPRAVVAAAIESHPTLARMRAEAAAARERIEPAASLPNPMLMAGVQNKQIDLRNDEMMTMYMVGISQTMVRSEKRDARREIAELEAQAMEKQVDSARAAIERDVLLAWYELAAADAQIEAASRVREMIDAVVAAARVRYEVGTAMQADVIRAQLQGSDLDHELLRLRGTRRGAATRLLSLLGLPLTTQIPPPVILRPAEGAGSPASNDNWSDHPAILALETEVARLDEEIKLMQLDRRPDLDLEAQYGHRPTQRDMFSVVARIELPLRAKQTIDPRVREAMLRRDAAKNRIDELRRSLTGALAEALVASEEAESQMKFHHDVLVPQAQLAFESTLAAYQTGNASFDAILTTETEYLRLHVQYYEFLLRHAQASVNSNAVRRGATEVMR
jgi:outer membrane protein TolC